MFNKLNVFATIIIGGLVATFSAVPAFASLYLTQPNGNCDSMGLNLTQSNYCSESSSQVYLENSTPYRVYYDFDALEDQDLPSTYNTTWTINDGTGRGVVGFDYDLVTPGIQLKEYTVYENNNYRFERVNNNREIDLFIF